MPERIITNYYDWESFIRKIHSEEKTIGYAMESNRLYIDNITFEDRVNQLKNKVDITVAVFNPDYQKMIDIDPQLSTRLFGDKPKTPVDEYIKKRKKLADYIFITPNFIPQRYKIKHWIDTNAPLLDINEYLDAYSYIRGCYATQDYLGTLWNERVDYIVACPWKMKYNIFCVHMVRKFGVDIDFPGNINEQEILLGA